jgi:hypothetical protein
MRFLIILALTTAPMTSGCAQVENLSNTEVAACEAYLLETLKSPSSYKRVSFSVVDYPVTVAMLLAAVQPTPASLKRADVEDITTKQFKERAKNPGIRGIALDYDADNSYGSNIRGHSACYFAMTDIKAGEAAENLESAVQFHSQRNNVVSLGMASGEESLCCLSPKFDLDKLNSLPNDPGVQAAVAAARDATGVAK